jgi:glycosyltransferase involved in cell wall biosynthesis
VDRININMISIIIPVYNESDNISFIYNKLINILTHIEFEIIFVNDGSIDKSLGNIIELAKLDDRVKYISFSRNFGHQNAIRAGFKYSNGDGIITLDCDGQHPVELINEMISLWNNDFKIVNTIRLDDNTQLFKKTTSRFFYKLINFMSDIDIKSGSADFRLIDRSVLSIINNFSEDNLFVRGIISWIGFKQTNLYYNANKREFGISKFSISKMFNLAINGILSFSIKPLRLSTYIGVVIAFFSFLYGIYALYMKIFTNVSIQGWSSILIMVTFIGGIQLIMIGILGEYIGKLFLESKKRPQYIIEKTNIF